MRIKSIASAALTTTAALLLLGAGGNARNAVEHFNASFSGFQEIAAIFSQGQGTLLLDVDKGNRIINYTLTYSGLSAPVTQSHIHFGKRHVVGSIIVFFCTNLGNGPAGTPACPSGGGTVTGMIAGTNVIGVAAQNFPAGDFDALVAVIESNTAYANIHTTNFPSGEIRGQVIPRGQRESDD